jgi:hypothetical protein
MAMAVVPAAGVANAAPIYLSCPGTWHHSVVLFEEASRQPGTLAITVDIANMTASVGEREFKIDRLSDDELMVQWVKPRTSWHVSFTLNRISGDLGYSEWSDEAPYKYSPIDFKGACKSVQKLF